MSTVLYKKYCIVVFCVICSKQIQKVVYNMSVGKRIKELRTHPSVNLTQTKFGDRIGLGQTAIGMYENEQRNVAEQTIILISKEFGVSEEWLRSGEGDMFAQTDETIFDRFVAENGLDALDAAIIRAFVKLPTASRHAIVSAVREMAKECTAASGSEMSRADMENIIEDKLAEKGM